MKGIYFIKNIVNEYNSRISGYFPTEDEAKDALKDCADWFRPNGTGEIWFKEFGLNGKSTLILKEV